MSRLTFQRAALLRAPFIEAVLALVISLICSSLWSLLASPTIGRPQKPTRRPTPTPLPPIKEVLILYESEFGNIETDGNWSGWTLQTERSTQFDPPNNILSPVYPRLGTYSTHNLATLNSHLAMIRNASIDALVVPWDGPWISIERANNTNKTSSFSDETLRLLFELAPKYQLKLMPLFPVFKTRNKTTIDMDMAYYRARYLSHPAHYKRLGKPMGIIYNAHELKTGAEFLDETTDMLFMAAALSMNDYLAVYDDGYIGAVTFFASDETSWGANHANWGMFANIARDRRIDFIPTVSPGFNDTARGKWNGKAVRSRKCTEYYDQRWSAALATNVTTVMINSFNGWADGTAIEPVVERVNYTLTNDVWCGDDPEVFLARTTAWVKHFRGM
jgi:glycoprotein endo-alpha-1,2-mannosidase